MNTMSPVALVVVIVLAVAVVGLLIYCAKLLKQSKINNSDLAEKETLIRKEAMIAAKESLQNEREKFNEEERERRRELNNFENKLSKREDELENKVRIQYKLAKRLTLGLPISHGEFLYLQSKI